MNLSSENMGKTQGTLGREIHTSQNIQEENGLEWNELNIHINYNIRIINQQDATLAVLCLLTTTNMLYMECTRVGTLIVTTIYLQLIQNRYMFRNFTVLQCSHQHCVQPVASDVEVVGYL